MRTLLILAVAALAGGCNAVSSNTPWFGGADAAGAPPLRQGVWRMERAEPCEVREEDPIEVWPKCAGAVVVREDDLTGFDTRDGKREWSSIGYVLAAGDPRVLQLRFMAADEKEASGYLYAGLTPTGFDAHGRITALKAWTVLCGPPPPADAKTTDIKGVGMTKAPFPGLTIKHGDCTAASREALHAAAKASEPFQDSATQAHWVRDGWR